MTCFLNDLQYDNIIIHRILYVCNEIAILISNYNTMLCSYISLINKMVKLFIEWVSFLLYVNTTKDSRYMKWRIFIFMIPIECQYYVNELNVLWPTSCNLIAIDWRQSINVFEIYGFFFICLTCFFFAHDFPNVQSIFNNLQNVYAYRQTKYILKIWNCLLNLCRIYYIYTIFSWWLLFQ